METKIPFYKIIQNISSQGIDNKDEIKEWLNCSSENKKVYRDLKDLWQVTGSFPERFSPDRIKAWKKVKRHIHSQKSKNIIIIRFAQIAAAIVLVFLSIWVGTEIGDRGHSPLFTEVIAPKGQKTSIILPDSSSVLLNGGSSVRYSNDFNESDRHIVLQGEGYFDVRKNLKKQFVVHTTDIDVKVFGTSFNIKAYGDDQTIEVGLKKGSIGIDRNGKEILKLDPGQLATFDKEEKKLDIQTFDIAVVSAWTKNELVFEENSIEEIFKYLERWYGVEFEVSPDVLSEDRLTFKVKTESLSETLTYLGILKPIKFQIDGKHVIISNP
ncbi:FecR family protein [Sunxiuqinia sp. A32]|uniref:FecR family protein n=1 Tax=Sunxiuqinia sp. A32 TaxID=3461496 RepID=UPI0040461304